VQLGRHGRRCFEARLDGVPVAVGSLVVARAHFYGGRFVLAPEARLDRPELHAVLFPSPTQLAALRYMAGVVAGTLKHQCDVEVQRAHEIELNGPEGAPVQIDGDIRAHLPATIRMAATPLSVIA
jgi:diacylglycerol kinase (ATP)